MYLELIKLYTKIGRNYEEFSFQENKLSFIEIP